MSTKLLEVRVKYSDPEDVDTQEEMDRLKIYLTGIL